MAGTIYIGKGFIGDKYLKNDGIQTSVNTNIDYIPRTGVVLDFVYLGRIGSNHILNVGGTGGATRFCFYIDTRGRTYFQYSYSGSSRVQNLVNGLYLIEKGIRYTLSWIVDTTTAKGEFVLAEHDTGRVIHSARASSIDTQTTTSLGKVYIYNSSAWDGVDGSRNARSSFIELYNLKIYDGTTLVMDLIPDPNGTLNQTAELYDNVSQQNITYTYDDKEAILKNEPPATYPQKIYVGVNGEPKEAQKVYLGVNGEATRVY